MIELTALLVIMTISLVVMRTGALALEKTGLSRESASFQAQSAFMGVGFTTTESESVVTHAVRRRIIRLLMLLGFGAITSMLGTTVLTFAQEGTLLPQTKIAALVGGILTLAFVAKYRPFRRMFDGLLTRLLESTTDLRVLDYEELLKANKGYTVAQITIEADNWMAGKCLFELALADEGVLILSITRESGIVLGTPSSRTQLTIGDKALCYGLEEDLSRIRRREEGGGGDRDHALSCERQLLRLAEERVEDELGDVVVPAGAATEEE